MDTIFAVRAAGVTGTFTPSASTEEALDLRMALQKIQILDSHITALRKAAAKENQIAQQVALNLEIQRNQKEMDVIISKLASRAFFRD